MRIPQFYSAEELVAILNQADKLDMLLSADGALEIAQRSRGTPRVANRLLRRVRDIALAGGAGEVSASIADAALGRFEVDAARSG